MAINSPRTKVEAIVVNVLVFLRAKLLLDRFDFSMNSFALDFFVLCECSKFLVQKFQQLNSTGGSSPKLVYFFTLNFISSYIAI